MKKILLLSFLILITVLSGGCSKQNNDNIAQFYCEQSSDCADCCTGECVNYEYWNHNSPDTIAGECLCAPTCTCFNNKCINKN